LSAGESGAIAEAGSATWIQTAFPSQAMASSGSFDQALSMAQDAMPLRSILFLSSFSPPSRMRGAARGQPEREG